MSQSATAPEKKGTQKGGPKPRKIPMRQCLGCNEHKPKAELIRVVRAPESVSPEGETIPGAVSLDLTGKKAGRGAYICRDVACLKKVRKSGRLARSLTCEISPEVYDRMEAELTADSEQNGGGA